MGGVALTVLRCMYVNALYIQFGLHAVSGAIRMECERCGCDAGTVQILYGVVLCVNIFALYCTIHLTVWQLYVKANWFSTLLYVTAYAKKADFETIVKTARNILAKVFSLAHGCSRHRRH